MSVDCVVLLVTSNHKAGKEALTDSDSLPPFYDIERPTEINYSFFCGELKIMSSLLSKRDVEGNADARALIASTADVRVGYVCANNRMTTVPLVPCSGSGNKHCKRCGLVGVSSFQLKVYI
jgi:hypothetical protein